MTAYGSVPAPDFHDGAAVDVIMRPEAVTLGAPNGAENTFLVNDLRFLGRRLAGAALIRRRTGAWSRCAPV